MTACFSTFYYYKCKKKFVILQSIGTIAIKSSETRVGQSADILLDILIPTVQLMD